VPTSEYYLLSTRLEAIQIAAEALRAHRLARHQDVGSYGVDDYERTRQPGRSFCRLRVQGRTQNRTEGATRRRTRNPFGHAVAQHACLVSGLRGHGDHQVKLT